MATSFLGLSLCLPSKNMHIFSLPPRDGTTSSKYLKKLFFFQIDTHSPFYICKLNHSVFEDISLWNNNSRSSHSTKGQLQPNPAIQTAYHYQRSRSCRASLKRVEGGFDPSTNSTWLENISFILPCGDFWRENSRAIAISSVWQSREIKLVSQGQPICAVSFEKGMFFFTCCTSEMRESDTFNYFQKK